MHLIKVNIFEKISSQNYYHYETHETELTLLIEILSLSTVEPSF